MELFTLVGNLELISQAVDKEKDSQIDVDTLWIYPQIVYKILFLNQQLQNILMGGETSEVTMINVKHTHTIYVDT